MLISFWSLVRFLHVLAAIVWVGGQLTLAFIVRPATHRTLGVSDRMAVFTDAGRRFGVIAATLVMPLLVATGVALAMRRGVTWDSLTRPGYGSTLGLKIVLAFVAFVVAGAHGAVVVRNRTGLARILGQVGLVTSLAVVVLATALVP